MILLDTHAFIWLASSSRNFSAKARHLITANASRLHISVVSAWEISILVRKGRLELPLSPEQYVEEAVEHLSLLEIPLKREIVQRSVMLPDIHNDPFDRVLVAECLANRFTLISADKLIAQYPGIAVVC